MQAARLAGEVIIKGARDLGSVTIDQKAHNDLVSSVDRSAEQIIISTIRAAFESHAIQAEESGLTQGRGYTWIVDPLDGTTNFLHGFPQYAVSIAVAKDGHVEHGVVYDPVRPEMFTASRGQGAHLYGMKIGTSACAGIESALLGTGFPFKAQQHLDAYIETFRALFTRSRGVRRAGAASLDLAYVAAGRLDGFWELGLKAWDLAAGALLVEEAGGKVSDFGGGDEYILTGNIVAATPAVFEDMHGILRPLLPADLRK